jgi:putative ABC transport system permease protein
MLKHYLKIAWRNIVKTPFYSFINVFGLSIGMAFAFLIGAFLWSELQINKNLQNAGRQYIIQSKWKNPDMGLSFTTLGPLAKSLKEHYPDLVANYYRWDGVTSIVSRGENHFREGLQMGDSTFLSMYGFSLIEGNPATALRDPYSVVITAEKAIKYFRRTDVVGQTLTIESFSGTKHDFRITGVLNKPAENSVTYINDNNDNQIYIASRDSAFFGRSMENWTAIHIVNYIELQKGVDPKDLEKPIRHLVKMNAPERISANIQPYLVSLNDFYLNNNNGLVKKMLFTLSMIALFILIMTIINFINISIARSSARMKEIGLRKVLGGIKKQVVLQFLTESVILVLLATGFALFIYQLSRDYLTTVLGKQIPPLSAFPIYFIFIPLAAVFAVGALAGLYPALALSSLKAVDALKGKLKSIKENIALRKVLVAFQFGTATMAFIGVIIISQQVSLFFSKDLGYNKEFLLSAQVPRDWSLKGVAKMEMIRSEFALLPQVKSVTLSYEVPNGNNGGPLMIYKAGQDSTSAIVSGNLIADKDYAATFGIPLAAGTFFDERNDSLQLVINETAVRALGWKDPAAAIGQQVRIPGFPFMLSIIGVTKDFHFESMQQPIRSFAFMNVNLSWNYRFLSFKINPGNIGQSIKALRAKWAGLMPGAPFEYTFMDENLQRLYKSEIRLKKASLVATSLAMVIVLLGVLGLISLSVQKRKKEIAIRKVIGSSTKGIMALFLKEFIPVIAIAGLIASPPAYLLMQRWLNDYAYRIHISAVPFIISIFALGILSVLLIGAQTLKASLANPMKALKSE